MMRIRFAAAMLLAVLGFAATPLRAEDALTLQLVTQPQNGAADAQPINIDSGDPVNIGTKLALIVTTTEDATVSIRYTPSDGAPALLAERVALKAGQSKRLPEDGGWYHVTSGLGEETLAAEDSSGAVLAKTSYRIVDSTAIQIGNLTTEASAPGGSRTRSIGGVNLGAYDQAEDVVSKSEAVAKTLEQATPANPSTSRSVGSNVFKKVANGVVLVVNGDFIGAGAILDQNGLVVTNHHVVAAADAVSVIFMPAGGASVDGAKTYDATVERIDVIADLALIRIKNPPEGLTLVKLGDPAMVEIGEEVNAIGHPHGEFWSYTRGYVSQIRPKYGWDDFYYQHQADVIQTQTPINPGNSGGPLLDDAGELIGINSFVDSEGQGLNYAVSVDEVTRLLQMQGDRLADGSVIEAKAGDGNAGDAKVRPAAASGGGSDSGDYQTWSYDDNGDGKPERWGVDMSGDGKPDLYLLDQDGDGEVDYGLLDRNQDGKPEARIIYGDQTLGECDVWEIDDDEDGKPDSIGMDYDYDGKPDVIRPA